MSPFVKIVFKLELFIYSLFILLKLNNRITINTIMLCKDILKSGSLRFGKIELLAGMLPIGNRAYLTRILLNNCQKSCKNGRER